ncbi:hypothetical protein B0H11DRAFT_1898259 [Mycena galericulata]|nr:hypothetical protein B0H11DRAFT_1898259 [Mycena galericulata]
MSASAETSKGAIFFSLIFTGVLFGVCISQTWLYFQWWPRDGWVNQAPVTILLLLESLQIACLFVSTYEKDLGHKDQLILFQARHSPINVQLIFACGSVVRYKSLYPRIRISVVEGHRGVTGSNIWYLGPFVAMILAFLQLSTGFSQAVISYRSDSYAMLKSARDPSGVKNLDHPHYQSWYGHCYLFGSDPGLVCRLPRNISVLDSVGPFRKSLNMRLHIQSEMYPKSVELSPAQASIAVPDTPNSPTSPPNSAQSDDLAPRKATMGYTSCETIV